MRTTAEQHPLLQRSPYQSYVYSYPHKTAYRPLHRPLPLTDVWRDEPLDSLFLYLHVPFCEQRCGFCNLFTSVPHGPDRPARYLDAVRRHADAVRRGFEALGGARFSRLAIGGGTPTHLSAAQLETMLDIATGVMGADPHDIPASVEVSPATVTPDRVAVLRARGIDRISIGVQTFDEHESKQIGRTQSRVDVHRALGRIREAGFSTLSIDLIYGGDGQTPASWCGTIDEALSFQPDELYLYPLYVRPCTGLARLQRHWDDDRLALYRIGRARLLALGYEQVSMRMFRLPSPLADAGPVYCCQTDGMVGLGCGARSYTNKLHFSSDYAVGRTGVIEILDAYNARSTAAFGVADHGIPLDDDEQSRRFVLMSLLQADGLDLRQYQERFSADPITVLPQLAELEPAGLATSTETTLSLTAAGLERSDAIGPWLWSDAVRHRLNEWNWR